MKALWTCYQPDNCLCDDSYWEILLGLLTHIQNEPFFYRNVVGDAIGEASKAILVSEMICIQTSNPRVARSYIYLPNQVS